MRKLYMLLALIAVLVLLFGLPARAESVQPLHVAAGVNGAWLDGPDAAFPADFEAGGTAWASLSPHLTAFADSYFGFSHSYLRWDGGIKATVTDAEAQDFSVYLSLKYRGGSISALHPNEAAYGAGFGWVPSPAHWPRVVLVGDASVGAQSSRTIAYLGVRYLIPLK